MKNWFAGLLCLGATISAHAQVTTLNYTGAEMTGTETYFNSYDVPLAAPPPSITTTLSDSYTAQIVISGSIADNDLQLVSYGFGSVDRSLYFGILGDTSSMGAFNGLSTCGDQSYWIGGCITLTASGDTITGAVIQLEDMHDVHGPSYYVNIGPTGDSYNEGASFCTIGCVQNAYLASTTPGTWSVTTSAPEIGSDSAPAAVTLLAGIAFVMRGRRDVSPFRRCAARYGSRA